MIRLCLFALLVAWVLPALAQNKPFTYGSLPAGWQMQDNTAGNNNFLQIGFARLIKADMDFGFIYEGGKIIVEQLQKPTTFEEFIKENEAKATGHANRSDTYTQTKTVKRQSGMTTFNGFKAWKLYLHCERYTIRDNKFEDNDITTVYLVQVGKVFFSIFTECDSEVKGGVNQYQREIDQIISTFRFFGSGGGGGGGSENNTNTTTTTTTTTTGGDDEDISIGDVVIGTVVAGGVVTGIGLGVRAIAKGTGAAAKGGASSPKGGSKGQTGGKPSGEKPQSPKNTKAAGGKKRKEEEPQEPEEEEEEEPEEEQEEPYRYVLQLSQNQFELSLGQKVNFQAAVWKINSKGQQSIADQAQIFVQANTGALNLQPNQGQGQLQCQIHYLQAADVEQAEIIVSAKAANSTFRAKIEVKLAKEQGEYELVTTTMPPDKALLKADGKDVWYLYAQVINRHKDNDPKAAAATKKIKFQASGPGSDWVYDFDPQMMDGWKAIAVQAAHPQAALLHPSQVVRPPKQVSISIQTQVGETPLTKMVDFPLEQAAILDVDRDQIYFPALPTKVQGQQHFQTEIKVFIEEPGEEDWTFTASYEKGQPALTQLEIIPEYRGVATLRIKTPSAALPPGQTELFGKIIIQAQSKQRQASNPRQVNITLRAEGIFVLKGLNNKGQLQISGEPDDPATESRFAVYLWDEQRREIVEDEKAARKLQFELVKANETNAKAKNMLSVAKLQIKDEGAGINNSWDFSFQVSNEIPGQEELLPFAIRLSTHSEITKQDYELDLPAAIFAQGVGPNSEDWKKEYDNCLRYIERHVPDQYKPDMLKMVETRKMSLGHEGLYHLRHKIHSINQNLILALGAEGYRQADKWYTDMIEILEWAEWAGNLAFNIVAGTVFGPYAPAVTIAKSYGIQALQYHLEGKGLDQWMYDSFTLHSLFKAGEGRLIDVDKIAEYFKNDGTVKSYAKAWAIYIGYHFAYNVFWEEKSVVEALKQVAREIRDEAIVMFFQKRLKAEADKNGFEPITDPLRKLKQSLVAKPNGQHEVSLDAVTACMRDPQTMRSLKKASKELQMAFNRTREAMYRQHDEAVKARIAKELGVDPADLKIDDFRTPGADPSTSINTDRDYRMLRKMGVGADGKEIWMEVPKEKWQGISYEEFGKATNKPPGVSDLEWAQKHLQLATDKYHIEASPDYSDHAIDPKTGEKIIVKPNIIAVEEGKSRLIDSTALGNMYHEKVHASLRMNQLSEAIAQCKKGVDTLDKVRKGYEMQDLPVGKLPKSIQDGMELVKSAPTDRTATPQAMAEFNTKLKDLGFHDLEDFSNKLASQFQALKPHDQGYAPKN